jgi:hypothetical protein
VRGASTTLYLIAGAIVAAGLVVSIGYPYIVSGILLAASGVAMLVSIRRRAAMPFIASLALAMLVVIGVYQHRLSEPARGALLHHRRVGEKVAEGRMRGRFREEVRGKREEVGSTRKQMFPR